MDLELINFKENVDSWVKYISGELTRVSTLSDIMEENIENIEHNYDLIKEIRNELEELRHEINAIKIIQIASLKAQMKKCV